jgi:hypothetical protein
VVDGQLEGCGSDAPGVLGTAGLATMLVRFHRNGGLPERVVATGGEVKGPPCGDPKGHSPLRETT